MKRLFVILIALLSACVAFAQAEKSIIIDASKFRPVQTDALTGVNIDPIGLDYSKRPCARLKIKINRMTVEEINGIEVKVATNNAVMKCQTAQYDTGLIVEMTAKPNTRFYFHHNEFGDSNEVCLNLEPNKEYYLEAYLNQLYSIVVNSNVAEADIYIDNVFKGRTDSSNSLIIKDMLVGEHILKVVYGKSEYEQKIVVNSGSISFRQNVNIAASEPQFVVFVVEPQSAVVIIDNKHYTLSDGTMSVVLDSGNYNYTVTAAGYHSQSGIFTVSGEKVQKNIKLLADASTVTLTAPNQAEIWINNKKMGVGSWSGTLNSGTYIFEARKKGHTTTKLSKNITSAESQQSYTLPAPSPIYGSLVVAGTPITADITLDGKVVGQIPLKLNNIIIGEHKIAISKAGYDTYTQSVTITESKVATINATLAKQSATSTSTTSAKGITSAPYKVGDYYNDGTKEGVVFEVSADGRSGKIVSMTQSRGWLQWSSDDAEQKRLIGADSRTDGAYNMAKVKAVSNWQSKYPAFKWCADLGEGWYLPSIEELKKFALDDTVHDVVNRTLASKGGVKLFNRGDVNWYWSSTESGKQNSFGEFCAWPVNMYGGNLYRDKYANYYVRAVAKFDSASKPTVTVASSGKIYKVGDYYNDGKKEGIVFEVSADGRSGKIVSMTQSTNKLIWSSDKAEQNRKLGMSENDGKFNMSKVESISGWQDKYLPFKWCADLGEGWYLPSFEEAKRFTLVEPIHKVVNKTLVDRGATQLSGTYWTSSEGMFKTLSGCYYAINVSIGKAYRNSYHSQKFNDYYVRAVATFGEAPPITEKFYVVGDYYSVNGKEGVVFEASADGKSGKIVSVKGSKEELAWTTDKNEKYRPSGAISHTDGAYNMAVIRTIPDWQNKFPAFKWCSDLGDDWYLPSIDELSTIIKYKDIVNSKLHVSDWLNNWYFSSTEDKELRFDNGYAGQRVYGIYVSSGEISEFYKSSGDCYVRAVSTFGDLPSPKDIVIYNKKYNIGDYYNENGKEGVIFEVSEDGNHGKIVSMKQSAEKLMWVSDKKERKKLIGADSNTDGAYNMAKVKAISDWQNKYPAFKWCADLGKGWYLPAKYEMITIRRYSDKLNARLTDKFVDCWSSTETNEKAKTSNKDWNGYYCIGGGGCKNSSEYVRAVAKF